MVAIGRFFNFELEKMYGRDLIAELACDSLTSVQEVERLRLGAD